MEQEITVSVDGDLLDMALYRHFEREVPGLVEDTLARNPGLAALGPRLPAGTVIRVKTPDPRERSAPRRIVRLW